MTAGSGPSYSKWKFWPVWTKLLQLSHHCQVIDVSGPAAGNKFISRSVITELAKVTPDLIVVQWNLGKFDIYSENSEFLQSVINGSGSRNFIVDIHTRNTTTGPGYWCSSHDNTHPWKKYYNTTIKSRVGTAMDDLESMLTLQNLVAKKNIPYQFLLHGAIDHDMLSTNNHTKPFYNEINWSNIACDPVDVLYYQHPSFKHHVEIPNNGRWVPNVEFQWHLLANHITKKFPSMGILPRDNWPQIEVWCKNKALELYEQYKKC